MSKFLKLLALCVCVTTLVGCATLRDIPYRDRRKAADKAFENEEYVLAAARYEHLRDRYPDTKIKQEMMFRQGVSLYSVSSYHDARSVFVESIDEYPRGIYAKDIKDYLRKIDVLMSRATPANLMEIEDAKTNDNLNTLNQLLAKHPTDWKVMEAIGDAQWKLGNYDEAIAMYYKAQQVSGAHNERTYRNKRLVLDEDGNPVQLNPKILRDMEIEENPLRVFNVNRYAARNQLNEVGGDIQFYNLTGSVRNQGKHLLRDVEVEVQFLNLSNQILDVELIYIGTLGPGEVRSFLVQANDYDNIYNIVDHEITVHWQK